MFSPLWSVISYGGGLMGLLSGLLAAMAYLQVTALGKAGEPEDRTVFYFSVGSIGGGALATSLISGWHTHTWQGIGMLLAVGGAGDTGAIDDDPCL